MMDWAKASKKIVTAALSAGSIQQKDANTLRRCYNLCDDETKALIDKADELSRHDALAIIEDGSGFFNSDGIRLRRVR